jgi:adenosylcobyric acid synthase
LLSPGPEQLEALTGVPTVAVLPMWREHGLPEEDGVFDDRSTGGASATSTRPLRIAVVAYPRISNLDEFQPLRNLPGVRLVWARSPSDLDGADWVVLPGSKHTTADLAWLRAQGLDLAVARHAGQGGAVLGICGGLQMLGEALIDLHAVDDPLGGNAPGLGLLPLVTVFDPEKLLRPTQARFATLTEPSVAAGPWSALSGVAFDGYEIHHGRTAQHPDLPTATAAVRNAAGDVLGWQQGNVLGLYAHGLFESPAVLRALFGAEVRTLDAVFDGLADFLDQHVPESVLMNLLKDR